MADTLARSVTDRPRIEDLERPSLDDRAYRIITLPNKLEVLLIHDAKTDKASAALDVNVGSFSDAEDMPGIAHAVEHLLFMGTEKYPVENAYNQYLTSHSGHSNAYTAATSTNYYFELSAKPTPKNGESSSADITQEYDTPEKNESPLYGGLDRFGQFFISPLFLEDTLDRELKAVDSENKKNLQSDVWRFSQLNKSLSNPNHPYCHFSTGSFKTLHDDPLARGVKIRDEFIKFYSTHYSANRMKLVILGREDLDTLEQWAEEIFSQVPNKDLPRQRWDDIPIYTKNELLTETFTRPVFESRALELSFLYRDEEDHYESHPGRYLSHLIGHEGPGSILSYIKEKGWANGLSAGAMAICPGTGLFNIKVALTEDGLEHYKEITKIIFQYIAMVREQPPQKWIVDEMIQMSEVEFRFKQKSPPSSTASNLASVMQKPYDRRHILSGSAVIKKFDEEAISQAMSYLHPDNFRLKVIDQKFPGGWDQQEKWYGTEYKTGKLPEDFVAEITEAFKAGARPKELHLPHKNEFIPSRLDVEKKEVDEPSKTPTLIRNDEGSRIWFKKDDQFWVPKANVHINLRTPLPVLTARTAALCSLYRDLVNDALVEYSYDADISGLVYSFSESKLGLDLVVVGYNDKLHVLLEKVLLQVRDLKVREDRFKVIHDRLMRGLRNRDFIQPYQQIGLYSHWLKFDKPYIGDDILNELESITAEEVQQFFPQVLAQFHTEALVHGNMHKEDALQISDLIEKTLKPKRLAPSQWPIRRSLMLPPGSNFIYERQLKDPANVNHCIEYQLYLGDATDRDLRARVLLIAQMTDEPAFNQLRTKEQLGYVVFSGSQWAENWAGYRILIQSEKDCRYLEGRIEHFLGTFEKMLDEMTEEQFEKHKRAVINKRLEKLKNLSQESNRFWNHIFSGKYDFLAAEEDVKHIEPLTKQQMKEFFAHSISPSSPHRAKLSVHMTAQAKPKQPSAEEQKDSALTTITTLLVAEDITPDVEKLKTLADAPSGTDAAAPTDALLSAVEKYLSEDMNIAKDKVDKVIDDAKAALGVAEVEDKLANPEVLTDGDVACKVGETKADVPVLIEDVHAWKAGLQMSAGARPVRDLSAFVEEGAKL